MVPAWLAVTVAGLTALSVFIGLIGVAAKYVALPWIKEQMGPLGNGFADQVLTKLERIERDIGGLRAEIRTEREERSAADLRIEAHQSYERERLDKIHSSLVQREVI